MKAGVSRLEYESYAGAKTDGDEMGKIFGTVLRNF